MNAFFIICAAAVLAFVPVAALQAVLATAASTLFESTPFILAGVVLAAALPRRGARLAPLLGCGCCTGPGALALPVFAATLATLGPAVAAMRWSAALAVDRLRPDRAAGHAHPAAASALLALLPVALASGILFSAFPSRIAALHPLLAVLCAAVVAFFALPCGFGAIAIAATLHHRAPLAGAAVLCVAGICDARALRLVRPPAELHDPAAYAACGLACFLLAWHHGNTLVNPRFEIPLYCSGILLVYLAWRYRRERAPLARWAPALMLAMSCMSVPPPSYHASETTLSDAFAGEELEFRGAVVIADGRMSLVRYTITCCRADAQPVSVRLSGNLREPAGEWIDARGYFVNANGALVLRVDRYERMAAPADPFLYR